jgi:heat shock protein HslJ
LEREYLERTAKSTETGTWEYSSANSQLTLRARGNTAPEYFSMSIGPTLRMLDAQGKVIQSSLNYTLTEAVRDSYAKISLESSKWRLIEIEGKPFKPASEEQDVTLGFDAREKRISGSGGCNRITGSYEADGNKLHFGPIASTRRMCPPDVMDKEATFLQTLELVASYKIAGGVLSLSGAGGTLLAKLTAEK